MAAVLLDALYPVVYLDCQVVNSHDSDAVQNKSIYLPLGLNSDGEKELPGLWIAQTEIAKFWLSVMNEFKNRGLQYIFIICCDGLKVLPEAIEPVYQKTGKTNCVSYMKFAHSVRYVNWKQRKVIAADLKLVYCASTLAEAELALAEFAEKWDDQYPTISLSWRNSWGRLSIFFEHPPKIHKVIYTTNAI